MKTKEQQLKVNTNLKVVYRDFRPESGTEYRNLELVHGSVLCFGLECVSFPKLKRVNGRFMLEKAKEIDAPVLRYIKRFLYVRDSVLINFPALECVGDYISLRRSKLFTAPALGKVGYTVWASDNWGLNSPMIKQKS